MKLEREPLAPAVIAGLLFILVYLGVAVPLMSPQPKTAEQKMAVVTDHQAIRNFIEAEMMAKRFCPEASYRWSHFVIDLGSDCKVIGHGVWFAKGTVDVPASQPPRREPWRIYFVPGEKEPLFVAVAEKRFGNEDLALFEAASGLTNKREP